mmetsp:Transcript_9873/g.19734  ORF Transcript_9873/g.19734 Transcript_9873/m.19734 type:complete len:342 (+) Transcript_9873:184-1209(+)
METTARIQTVRRVLSSPETVFKRMAGSMFDDAELDARSQQPNTKALRKALKSGEKQLKTWTSQANMVQIRTSKKKKGTKVKSPTKVNSPHRKSSKNQKLQSLALKGQPSPVSGPMTASSPALVPFTATQLFVETSVTERDLFGAGSKSTSQATSPQGFENTNPNAVAPSNTLYSSKLPIEEQEQAGKRKIMSPVERNKRSRISLEGDKVQTASNVLSEDDECFDVGIWWKIKNHKFIVLRFALDSEAPSLGVRPGDILRSVDGVDVLDCETDSEGNHTADGLLCGKRGSACRLTFLRVAKKVSYVSRSVGTPLLSYACTLSRTSLIQDTSPTAAAYNTKGV